MLGESRPITNEIETTLAAVPNINGDCVAVFYADGVLPDGTDGTIQIVGWDDLASLDTSKPALLISIFKRSETVPCIFPSSRGDVHFNGGGDLISLKRRVIDGEMEIRATRETSTPELTELLEAGVNLNVALAGTGIDVNAIEPIAPVVQIFFRSSTIAFLDTDLHHALHSTMTVMFVMVDDFMKVEAAQDRTDLPACNFGCTD